MKIMQLFLTDYNIRLTDSLNFLQMPLLKLPKTSGLDLTRFSKGDFPFKFNAPDNTNYVGPIPSVEFYSPETNSQDERKRILDWHKDMVEISYVFDFQKEMFIYCSQDVTILRLCCLEFRALFMSETEVDLFVTALLQLQLWRFIVVNI